MRIEFIKCHGSGNDFVLVDCISNNIELKESDYSIITKLVCARDGIIGADGTLFMLPSVKADVRMRIFNSDGSEPEMCGNGIRCITRRASEKLKKAFLSVETMKAILDVSQEKEIFNNIKSYSVTIKGIEMSYDTNFSIFNNCIKELSNSLKFTSINLGNPHIISNVDFIDAKELEIIGKKANNLPHLFPNGVNVSFFKKIDNQTIYVLTYERGVGMTYSCGTAMSAASIVSGLLEITLFNEWVNVYNKGGLVKTFPVKNESDISVKLLGNATFVYNSEFDYKENINKLTNVIQGSANLNEIMSYGELQNFCEEYLKNKEIE